jgi:cellulose synthase/poly-beta-1,6-N-acetylglucosamine synthase-like glycosyltransferase
VDEDIPIMVSTSPMIQLSKNILAILHVICVCGLAAYGCHRLWLLFFRYRKFRYFKPKTPRSLPEEEWPRVTIQLPLFNEKFVTARLLAAAARLSWPKDRLEIQVLDDSTDETRQIVTDEAGRWRKSGIDITVLRRKNRRGYKAGALAAGLKRAKGEFVAIFDADFLPEPDFLCRSIPYFSDPEIGMVQARWGFLNEEYSWLTRIQSILIRPHFHIEHWVRCAAGLFFNFNGTAGVWRRSAILSAGGWRADTVTEDLDLSYRAQTAGWRFIYLDDLIVPSEIPATLSAFRSQQQRWAKGSIQTSRKILPILFRTSQPLSVKIEACAHLLANCGWLSGAVATLTLYPSLLSRSGIGPYQLLRFDIPLMLLSIGSILCFFIGFIVSQREYRSLAWLLLIPVFSIGIAPAIALSVLEGAFFRGGKFERTPKFGLKDKSIFPASAVVYHRRPVFYLLLNLSLAVYCLLPVHFAWQQGTWPALPFLMLFPIGFLLVAGCEMEELRLKKKCSRALKH